MIKLFWLLLLVVGLILLVWGASTLDPSEPGFSLVFTGRSPPKALWLLTSGFIGTLVGLAGTLRSSGS